jgi:predicted ATPase
MKIIVAWVAGTFALRLNQDNTEFKRFIKGRKNDVTELFTIAYDFRADFAFTKERSIESDTAVFCLDEFRVVGSCRSH